MVSAKGSHKTLEGWDSAKCPHCRCQNPIKTKTQRFSFKLWIYIKASHHSQQKGRGTKLFKTYSNKFRKLRCLVKISNTVSAVWVSWCVRNMLMGWKRICIEPKYNTWSPQSLSNGCWEHWAQVHPLTLNDKQPSRQSKMLAVYLFIYLFIYCILTFLCPE